MSARDWGQSQVNPPATNDERTQPGYTEPHEYAYVLPPVPTGVVERDPTGRDPHNGGAKLDAGKVEMTLVTRDMARALRAVAEVSTFGARKYSRGGWVLVEDGFRRYADAQDRHANDFGRGESHCPDSGLLHLAHEAWNALAKLDLYLREQEQIKKTATPVSRMGGVILKA
jgi:hypothetical protein